MKLRVSSLFYVVLISFLSCMPVEESDLLNEFRYSNTQNVPNISIHRGGKGLVNYPENCLETMMYLHKQMEAIFEIDIAQTRDGILVLMHDNSVDRTTDGSGLLKNKTLEELSQLYLVDDYGIKTSFKIPLLREVLEWAKLEDVVLTLDIKRDVSLKKLIGEIRSAKAEDHCIIITYSLDQALEVFQKAPQMMLSVSARNNTELDMLLDSEIPTRNMLAFTGTRLSQPELYQRLHKDDILAILGTLGNLDRRAEARGDHLYREWAEMGVDLIATDRPLEVYQILKNR
jgi:glycerophosphoryl diester phosphodiesterase